MQYSENKDHLENVEKIMNCNQVRQILIIYNSCRVYGASAVWFHIILAVIYSITEIWQNICETFCLFLFLHTQQKLHSLKHTAACRSEFEQWCDMKFYLQISYQIVCVKNSHSSYIVLGKWERREWFLLFNSCGLLDFADR